MKRQNVRFPQRPDPHPTSSQVAAQRAGGLGRTSASIHHPLPALGRKSLRTSGPAECLQRELSGSSDHETVSAGSIGSTGRCYRACLPKRTTERGWNGKRLGRQIRKKGRADRICRRHTQGRFTFWRGRDSSRQPRVEALPHFSGAISRQAVTIEIREERCRETGQGRTSNNGAQAHESRRTSDLALETAHHVSRLGGTGGRYGGALK